ncbi:hypothetical protein V5O48_002244 [Marasmius crinis-equi]|uniref:BTB domain-containing protein n=1 Tax=Marasmius crinis-equi TaxID=585013 RepID=A0ABR3FWH4_9AGAR
MVKDLSRDTSTRRSTTRTLDSAQKRARPEDEASPKSTRSKRAKSSSPKRSLGGESVTVVDEHYSNNGGDIYLRLPDGTHFMCHLEKLKTAGGLFGDVFALPQPVESAESIGGLPFCDIYQLLTPGEFRFILDFIYGKIAAMALLKGAHMLNLPKMRRAAMKGLHLMFPCDSGNDRWPPVVHGMDVPADLFQRLFPIQAVNLFTQCEVPLFLPMAYYYASQLDIDDILFGVRRPDGSVEHLGDGDKSLVLKSRDKLSGIRKKYTHEWLAEHGNERGDVEHELHGCWMKTSPHTGQTCFDFIQSIKRDWESSGFFERMDCLNGLPQEALQILKRNICTSCYEEYHPRIVQGVWDAWWELPGAYGLGTWSDLTERQKKFSEGWYE